MSKRRIMSISFLSVAVSLLASIGFKPLLRAYLSVSLSMNSVDEFVTSKLHIATRSSGVVAAKCPIEVPRVTMGRKTAKNKQKQRPRLHAQ